MQKVLDCIRQGRHLSNFTFLTPKITYIVKDLQFDYILSAYLISYLCFPFTTYFQVTISISHVISIH